MIVPDRFMDLNMSTLRISSLILKQLKRNRMMKYDKLLDNLVGKEGEGVRFVFLPALSLLYLLGKVEYHIKTDSIEVLR